MEAFNLVIPGFTYTPTAYATPVYTLRGIGLYDSGVGSSPAVSVYVDEVPLAYPIMTDAAALDIQRVEVLKGPQGTLFGENSTGGAINYIANKPTSDFRAGLSLDVNNFGKVDGSGYVSGPITDTLNARFAFRKVAGGAWQNNINAPGQKNGDTDLLEGRLLLDWRPLDDLKVSVNLNYNLNRSDNQAPQLQSLSGTAANNAFINAAAPGGKVLFPPHTDEGASYDPRWPMNSFEPFYQVAVRADYTVNDNIVITSITAAQEKKVNRYLDEAGDGISTLDDRVLGSIRSYNEELRAAGTFGPLKTLLGASFEHDNVIDADQFNTVVYPGNQPLPTEPPFNFVQSSVKSKTDTYAIFGNAEYKITDNLSGHFGLRGTRSDMTSNNCTSGDEGVTALFNYLQGAFNPAANRTIVSGECYPFTKDLLLSVNPFSQRLNQNNVSGRIGLDYKFDDGLLTYANASRGFKSGVITDISASSTGQFQPAKEEKVNAYEIGFKAPFFDRRLQVNGAARPIFWSPPPMVFASRRTGEPKSSNNSPVPDVI